MLTIITVLFCEENEWLNLMTIHNKRRYIFIEHRCLRMLLPQLFKTNKPQKPACYGNFTLVRAYCGLYSSFYKPLHINQAAGGTQRSPQAISIVQLLQF